MNGLERKSEWGRGDAYEPYVGRWSRLVAREFLSWLEAPRNVCWLDVGCGTGALSRTILDVAAPSLVQGIDPSADYVSYAREHITDARARVDVGDARTLPYQTASFDVVVSGLAINFVPEPARALSEMVRVTRGGGTVALYVWDYAGEMQLMRYFWAAAATLDPAARELDEGRRFPICNPISLRQLGQDAGLRHVEVRAVDVPTIFHSFDDYWAPFLGGQGPAPSYALSLSEEQRIELRELIRARLPIKSDGRIDLIARAWAVRGER
ncbi:MAG: class I SAM-dependent methyltransferase [Pyrinomonadaceae bacterium]|nr:class I SAM-dependent methyltransferase [Pyrinomonadaceae bacterium]